MKTKAELQAMGFEPTPVLKAVRAKCLDCSGGSHAEVADCQVKTLRAVPAQIDHLCNYEDYPPLNFNRAGAQCWDIVSNTGFF
jgi:hypothetical protein